MNQDLFFNEHSIENKTYSFSVVQNLRECYLKLKENNFSVCRVSHELKQEIMDYLINIPGIPKRTITSFLYSFLASPFEKDSISEEDFGKFINHDLYFENKKAIGLLWAYTYETAVLSLFTDEKWNIDSLIAFDKTSDSNVQVHNVCTIQNITSQKQWIDSLKELELIKTTVLPENKLFHPREDHGKDILLNFWNKLKKNDYIISGINSLPFNPKCRIFIKEINNDGKIEIVLHWTDQGLGLVIQTTGRNYRETKAIAELLEQEYDC